MRLTRYKNKELDITQSLALALEGFGIEAEQIRTIGGKTGVRVWVSQGYPIKLLKNLHAEIVLQHGRPIALDVREYLTEDVFYSRDRPPMTLGIVE